MGRTVIKFIIGFIISGCCLVHAQESRFDKLYQMYQKKDFFRFITQSRQSVNELDSAENLVLSSFMNALLNRPAESNNGIDSLFQYYPDLISDSLKIKLLEAKLQNLGSIFDYQNAFVCNEIILNDYKQVLDSAGLESFLNYLEILKATKNLGRQSVRIESDSRIRTRIDLAGLTNVELKINGFETEFIFDTGANISTIMRSNADKFKLKYLEGSIKVGTVTGTKVDANLAYAEHLEIGRIKYQNVLFIVLPDDALTFAGGFYKIDGIIGLPVLKEMKEIHLTKDELFVPLETSANAYQNLVFDGFTPVVNVVAGNDTLSFNFDTGARGTVLYNSYFALHEKELMKKYKLEHFEVEGAGGKKKIKGVELDQLILSIAGSNVLLDDVKVFAEEIEFHKNIFGNLGQDYMINFDEMIMNFENMYIEFVKK